MGRPSKEQRLAAVHEDALHEFNAIAAAMMRERKLCLRDRRFHTIYGAQWEGLERQFKNKPRLEVNKLHRAIRYIVGECRNNRMDVSFLSKDGAADDTLADTCASLHRSDEQDSSAREAYDNGFEEALGGGIGAWRLRSVCAECSGEYECDCEEAGPQRIQMEPIFDADSCVFFDLNAKRQDKSDARTCYVLTSLTRDEYIRRYDDDPATWPNLIQLSYFDWIKADVVYIAERYVKETVKETVHTFRGISGEEVSYTDAQLEPDDDGDIDLARELAVTGFKEIGQKKTKRRQVHKYVMNGARIMDDCGAVAGSEIPIVMVYAERSVIDNVERCMGLVRMAMDPQKIKNMLVSKVAEISALSVIEKPIVTPEQIAGHEQTWAEDNIENYAYRLINSVEQPDGSKTLAPPIGTTKPPSVPDATVMLHQVSEQDIRDALGNPEEAEKMISHVAGKSVEAIQQRIDGNSLLYMSNLAEAKRRSGQIWLSMAREIYTDEGRKIRGVGRRNERMQIELMKPVIGEDGAVTHENDLTRANFDVVVDVGPSSASKRQAIVRNVINMLPAVQDPQMNAVLVATAVANMEGEGLEDLNKYAHKALVRLGVGEPTPQEAQELAAEKQGQQPSAADQYALAAAKESEAKAQQSIADAALIAARTDKTKADTIQTLASVDLDRRKAATDAAESLHGMLTTPQISPGQGASQ